MFNMAKREIKLIFSMYKSRFLIMLIIPFIITLTNTNKDFFSFYTMMGGVMVLAIAEIDSRDKANMFILSAPCKRSDYVLGKFLAMIIWMAIIVSSGVVINLILYSIVPNLIEKVKFTTVKVFPVYLMMFTSIYYFVHFSLNYKVAKVWYFVSIFGIMIGFIVFESTLGSEILVNKFIALTKFINSTGFINNILFSVIVLAGIAILAVSSVVLYEKKDF